MKKTKLKFSSIPGYDPFREAGKQYFYDAKSADNAVKFAQRFIKFTKGKWKEKPFKFLPWELDIIRCFFGWKNIKTGLRRYSTIFVYVPRKNGKSQLVAAIALIVFFLDKEPDGEIYIGARDTGQALTLYRMVEEMCKLDADLYGRVRLKESTKEIISTKDNTKIKAISADALSAHGYSPSLGIIDELHAQPDGKLVEALKTGMGARQQPAMVYITTADEDRVSICNDELEYAKSVREGKILNPEYLPVIFEATADMDWRSESTWKKANPSYPTTPSKEFLTKEMKEAEGSVRKQLSFKRLYLNMKTASLKGWLNMDFWRLCGKEFNEDDLTGQECYSAGDLASKLDMNALSLFFPVTGHIINRFYVPKKAVEADKSGHYQEWIDEGWLTVAGDDVADYDYIEADIDMFAKKYKLKEFAYDPHNANQFALKLQKKGIEIVEFTQCYRNYTEPAKEFEAMIKSGKVIHNSKILDWMASNVSIKEGPSGDIMPCKPKRGSPLKIDGIPATIMAIGRWMVVGRKEEPGKSIFENNDMVSAIRSIYSRT